MYKSFSLSHARPTLTYPQLAYLPAIISSNREFSLAYSQLDCLSLVLLSLALLPGVSLQHFLSHARSPTFYPMLAPRHFLSPNRLSPPCLSPIQPLPTCPTLTCPTLTCLTSSAYLPIRLSPIRLLPTCLTLTCLTITLLLSTVDRCSCLSFKCCSAYFIHYKVEVRKKIHKNKSPLM